MNARYSVGLQYGSHQVVLKSRAAAGHIIGAHPQVAFVNKNNNAPRGATRSLSTFCSQERDFLMVSIFPYHCSSRVQKCVSKTLSVLLGYLVEVSVA